MKKHPFAAYAGLPGGVYTLFAARLVTCMGSFIMPLLTLILTQKLGMSTGRAGATVSLLVITQAPCLLLGGRLADTIGRKPLLLLGYTGSAALYLLCALAHGSALVVPCIVLAADFAVLGSPASDALLAELAGPEHRQSAFSLLYLGMNIGMMFSSLLGGLLFRNYLWLLFVLDAVTTLLCAGIIFARITEPSAVPPEPASAGAPAAQDPEQALAGQAVTLLQTLRAAPVIVGFVLLLFCYDFCYAQWSFLLPAQMGSLFGAVGAQRFSLLAALNCFTVVLVTPWLTAAAARLPALCAIAAGGALYALGCLGFSAGGGLWLFALSCTVFTLGEILCSIRTGAYLADRTPPRCRGRVNAFSSIVRGSANAVSPAVMGVFLAGRGYCAGWWLAGGVALAAAFGMLTLRRVDHK